MRKAILEGLEVEFAMAPLPLVAGVLGSDGGTWGARGRGRGGRLEIAGVVVGQWGGGSYPARAPPRYQQMSAHTVIQLYFSLAYECMLRINLMYFFFLLKLMIVLRGYVRVT